MRAGSPPPYVGPPPVPKMPAGLVDLVEGLTREVLRNNPKDVYEFCAKHLEKLLESRDGSSFKKPMLTLEQKIHKAQEKVRQKAKERRERYDSEINARSNNSEQPTTELQQIAENKISKSESDVSINAMPPVHHEEGLKPDSEVEIAHEASCVVDEDKTKKIKNVETIIEEVQISPEAFIVNDSNTDLTHEKDISKEARVNAETTLPIKADDGKAVENINANVVHVNISASGNTAINPFKLQDQHIASEKDISKEAPVNAETTLPIKAVDGKAVENINVNDVHVNISASGNTAISPFKLQDQHIASDVKEHSETTQYDENITFETVPDIQSLKEENMVKKDNSIKKNSKNNSLSSTEGASGIQDDSNSAMPLNKDISTKQSAESQRASVTAIEPPTLKDDTKFNKNEASLTENKLDDIKQAKKDENNEHVMDKKLHDTKEVDSLSANRDEHLNANAIEKEISIENMTEPNNETESAIEDTSNIPRITNSEVINGIDLNSIKGTTNDETPIGNDAVAVPELVGKNINILDKELDDAFDKTAEVEEDISKSTKKHLTEIPSIKPEISMTSTLNAKVTEHTKDNIIKEGVSKESKEIPMQEKDHTDIHNTTVKISDNSEIVNDETSSLVESDLSKIEEDTTGETQNEQNNMDLETAAVTIQKVFRTFLFKSRNSTFDDGTNDEGTSLDDDNDNIKKEEYYAAANLNKERRPLGISRMDTMLQTVNEEKSLSLSTDDSSTLSSAATTIQAHVRGFLVRNRLNSNKTVSTNSVNSNELLEPDMEQQKNKTVLNIHIVPEEGNYLSRDESIITSMELSLDGSPPSSVNLHPLSYDVSERRKLLKREDAVQSISPPSTNSGKLSEESVKELFINDDTIEGNVELKTEELNHDSGVDSEAVSISSTATATTIINVTDLTKSPEHKRSKSLQNMDHDESDVVTPYVPSPRSDSGDYENSPKLVHSGEFHDVLLPTRVTRKDTSVVREFKNVLVYFIIWNH